MTRPHRRHYTEVHTEVPCPPHPPPVRPEVHYRSSSNGYDYPQYPARHPVVRYVRPTVAFVRETMEVRNCPSTLSMLLPVDVLFSLGQGIQPLCSHSNSRLRTLAHPIVERAMLGWNAVTGNRTRPDQESSSPRVPCGFFSITNTSLNPL